MMSDRERSGKRVRNCSGSMRSVGAAVCAAVPALLEHLYAATRDPYPQVASAAVRALDAVGTKLGSPPPRSRRSFETDLRHSYAPSLLATAVCSRETDQEKKEEPFFAVC